MKHKDLNKLFERYNTARRNLLEALEKRVDHYGQSETGRILGMTRGQVEQAIGLRRDIENFTHRSIIKWTWGFQRYETGLGVRVNAKQRKGEK